MQVKSIAECSMGAFCNPLDLYKATSGLEKTIFSLLLSGRLRQVLLYRLTFGPRPTSTFLLCVCPSSKASGKTVHLCRLV